MNDRLTTLLHEQAARLDVRLTAPGGLRRTAQHKRAVRRSATAAVAAATAVAIVVLFTVSNPIVGASHRDVPDSRIHNSSSVVETPAPSASYPAHFAGLPPVGAQVSLPEQGRLLLDLEPETGAEWNVYADGRIIWQRWTPSGGPLVIPSGADRFQIGYVQQRLTPQGAQLLLSRILAIGHAAGLFRHNVVLVNAAFDKSHESAWYKACNNHGHVIHAQVLPTDLSNDPAETPAQIRALAQITHLMTDSTTLLPASAWADRTIRAYIPSHYWFHWDRADPDPSKLPSPAREALAQSLLNADQGITTEQARALFAAFAQSGVKLVQNTGSGQAFEVPAVRIPTTVLGVSPALPDDSDLC